MSTRKTILTMAGIAFILPRCLNAHYTRIATKTPSEPGMCAWFATTLEAMSRFGR